MSSDLYFNNVKFISAKQAGLISGYSPDYVGQLCRGNKLVCQRVGKSWYVKEESLVSYMAVVAEQLKQTRELQSSALKLVQVNSVAVSSVAKKEEDKKEVSRVSSTARVVAPKTTRSYPLVAFYSHYLLALPLLLAKLAESVRTHRSFFYTDLIKKTASLAFVFMFGFGLAGAATINASKIAQVPRKVYSAISDINTYYAAGFAQAYLSFGETLFDSTRFTLASLEKCGSNPALCITGSVRSVASVQSKTVDTSASATLAFVENTHARTFAYISHSLAFGDQKVMNAGVSVGRGVSVSALAQVAAAPQTVVDKAGTRVYRTVNSWFTKSGGALLSLFSDKKSVIVINPTEIRVSASREAQSTVAKPTVAYSPSVIVKNNTVIERIVEVLTTPQIGIYTDIQKQITDLNSSVNNRFAGLSTGGASTGNAVTNIYQQIAQSQRIDRLDNVVLNNPTFAGTPLSPSIINFAGGFSAGTTTLTNLIVTNTSTSTFAGGIDLASGCIAQNGVCITGGGGGSGDVGAGTTGQIPFYAANGTELTATSSLFIASNGYIGVGSTTPFKNFSVVGDAAIDGELRVNSFLSLGSTTLQNATSTSFFASLLQAATAGFDTLSSTFATLTNLTVTNSTTTNATSTNLFSTNFVATNSTTTNSYISSLVALNASTTNASTTNLYATSISSGNVTSANGYVGTLLSNTLTANSINATSSTATSTFTGGLSVVKGLNLGSGYIFGGGLTACSSSADKLIWDAATGQFGCGADAGAGGGITGLRAQYSSYQTGSSQTFATSSDTNIGLTITSAGDIHTFTPVWSGVLSVLRGGTGISNPTAAGVLLGNYAGTGYMQVATSSLGLSTSNIAEGSNLYYLDSRVQAFIHGSTTIPKLYSDNTFAGTNTFNGALVVGALNGPLQANNGVVSATTSIGQLYGGTGITSYTAGDILYANSSGALTKLAVGGDGLVLKINAGLPSWQTDITSGGGGGATAWSTTTNSMIVYPTDTADILVVGSNATTTTGNIFEVAGNSLFGGNVSVGSTTPFAKLSVNATGGVPSFAIGSSTGTSFIVDKNGNVGVGTAAPTDKLYVNGDIGIKGTAAFYPTSGAWYGIQSDAGVDGLIMGHLSGATPHVIDQTFLSLLNGGNVGIGGVSASTNPVVKILTSGRVGIGSTTPSALLSVNAPAGIPSFAIGSSTATQFIVSASGNIGIGTTNTETKLAVNGDISLPRTSNIIFGQNSDGTGEKIGNSSYGLSFYVSNAERLRIGAAKTYVVGNGSGSGLEFRNSAGGWSYGGIYTEDISGWNGALVFTTDGDGVNNNNPTEKMRISPDGNIGIGTTSPYAKLSVVGEVVSAYFTATTTATSTLPRLLTTNATTTSFAITGITSSLLKTNASGSIIPAILGTDYVNYAFPFTVSTGYNSTSTTIGFSNGLFSTASSTFSSSLNLPSLSNGALAVFGGLVSSGATTTAGTGLTYSGNAFNVNTSQNISTLSNLTTNGIVTTSGGTGALSVTANGTNGTVLAMSGGVPTWVATTTLSTISGTLSVAKGGTNATSFAANSIIVSDAAGTTLIATGTQLTVGNIIATTTATSYFLGNVGVGTTSPFAKLSIAGTDTSTTLIGADALSGFTSNLIDLKVASTTKFSVSGAGFATTTVSGLNISASATTTSNVGINIATGCFSVNGSCLTNSTAVGNVNPGTAGQFPYYAGSGTTLTATSSLYIDPTTGAIGVGTQSPGGRLAVRAQSTDNAALVVDSGPDSNPWAIQFARDGLSSAYVYMQDNATLGFQATLNPFTDDDSSQTLGTPSKRWNALNIGTGASSFGGNLSVTGTLGVTGQTTLRQASSTGISAGYAYFGTTATSSFSNTGVLTLASALTALNGGTGLSSVSAAGVLLGNYTGTGYQQIATSSLGLLTTNITEGSNLYYLDSRVQSFIHSSTTIPKTYTANTFTGANTFNSTVTFGSLNGPLQANNGVVSATTSVGVLYGGTGLTAAPSYGNILVGNNAGGYTLTATSSLGLPTFAFPFTSNTSYNSTSTTIGFTNGLFSTASSTFSGPFRLGALSNGALAVYSGLVGSYATTTAGTGLTYSGNAFNVNTSQNISTLSNLTSNGVVYTAGGTGALNTVATSTPTIGASLSYSGTIGSFLGGASGTLSLNTANANTWSALQTFSAGASSTVLSANTGYFNNIFATSTTQFSGFGATTTPFAQLSINSVDGFPAFVVGSSTRTSFIVDKNGNVGIGVTSSSSALTVQSANTDASTSVFNVSSSTGASLLRVSGNGRVTFGNAGLLTTALNTLSVIRTSDGTSAGLVASAIQSASYNPNSGGQPVNIGNAVTVTTAQSDAVSVGSQSFTQTSAPSNQFNILSIRPTYNQASGAVSNSDLYILRTETAVGSGAQNLINAQVGGALRGFATTTMFSVSNNGVGFLRNNLGLATTAPFAELSVAGADTVTPLIGADALSGFTSNLIDLKVASTTKFSVSGAGFATTTVSGLTISGSATSTSNVGFNITTGCFAVNGSCLTNNTAVGTVNTGTAGQFPYYAGSGTTLTATSSLYIDPTTGAIGAGTASPAGRFHVRAQSTDNAALVVDSGPDSNPWAIQFARDGLSSAYVYMQDNATLGFQATLNPFTDDDSSQTLGTPSKRWNALNIGTGASSFGGNLSVTGTLGVTGQTTLRQASSTLLSANTGYFNNILATSTTQFSAFGATTTPFAQLSINSIAGSPSFAIGSSTATSFIVDKNGNVGVNTTNPQYAKLQIAGDIAIEGTSKGIFQLGGTTGALAWRGAITNTGEDTSNALFKGYRTGGSGAADLLQLYTDNLTTPALFVNGSGNVGIGSSSPTANLVIQANLPEVTIKSTGGYSILNLNSQNRRWALNASDSSFAVVDNTAAENRFAITNAGNIGIGTTTPIEKFAVAGGNALIEGANSVSLSLNRLGTGFDNYLNFKTNLVSDATVGLENTTGNFLITGPSSAITRLSAGNSATLNLSAGASSVMTFSVNNAERARFDTNGNLGIGTTTPFGLLAVNNIAGQPGFVVGSSTDTSFIVDQFGNVGIGTTSPASTLEVRGTSVFSPQTNASGIFSVKNSNQSGTVLSVDTRSGNVSALNAVSINLASDLTNVLGTNGSILAIGNSGAGFSPTSGSRSFYGLNITPTINQTGSASGSAKGILVAPTLTSAVNYTNIETLAYTQNLLSSQSNISSVLLGTPTMSAGSSLAVTTASNLRVSGAPIAAGSASITTSAGIYVDTSNVSGGVADAYGLYVNTPSGATRNYAATFAGGNVGIGTTTPNALLSLQKVGGTADLLRISSTTGASMITVSQWGGFAQNISSTSALSIRNGSNVPVFEVDTTQTTTNAGLDITAGSSQTGNLLNFYSSGGSFLSGITAAGGILMNVSSSTAVNVLDGSNVAAFVVNSASKSVGIGTSTLTYNLNVEGSQSGTYIARINNADTSTNADGLLISLGVANASRTTSNYFIGFSDGAGTVAGKIQGGASAVAYTTSAADLAEYFSVASTTDKPAPGEVVALAGASTRTVTRASGGIPFGIVSTNPGFIGNGPICPTDVTDCDENYKKYNVLVALTGQVPVRVNAENGAIKVGDSITLSSTAGIATKALPGDPVLAIAIEAQSFATTTATTTVLAYIAKTDSLAYNYTDLDIATSTAFASGLDLVKQLESIEFTYAGSQKTYLGFVPGAVELINPKLIKHTTDGSVLGLNHDAFLPVITNAIKELDVKVSALDQRISDLELAGSAGNGSGLDFAAIINQFENIGARFVNGIAYLKNVFVETLTVGTPEKPTGITLYDEVTGEPYCLKVSNGAMVSAVGVCVVIEEVSPVTGGNATTTDTIAPEILIMGNNPAEIQVGSSYVDLGATVTDMGINPMDPSGPLVLNSNLGIQYAVNGVSMSDVMIDTSATSTHTIVFSAVDMAGNWGYATRTVEVIPIQ